MKKLTLGFLSISILTSFITQTFGSSGLFTRITVADIFGLVAFSLFAANFNFKSTAAYRGGFLIVLAFSVGLLASEQLGQTMTELLVLLFLVLSSITIYSAYRSYDGFLRLLRLVIYTALLAAFFGFYGFVASITGLPQIFPGRASGEILSGFRNAGQAGAFVLVMLTILMPLRFSSAAKQLDKKHQMLLSVAIYSSVVFLFLTGKIAAYIGFAFCIAFSALQKRQYGYVIALAFGGLIISLIWSNLETIAPAVYTRINTKIETRITQNLEKDDNDNEDNFIAKNLGEAMRVFEEHPVTGSGIGGFGGVYGRHEVHSTYFKLLGETGLAGTFAYIVFIVMLMQNFSGVAKVRSVNPYADFLWNMRPFLLGCFISWSYTYHLRKREFWVLVAIITIASYLKRNVVYTTKAVPTAIS